MFRHFCHIDYMTPHLTDEQREALQAHPDTPLRVEDEQTQKVYLVVADLSAEPWGCISLDAVVAEEDLSGALPGEAPLVDGPLLSELTEAP